MISLLSKVNVAPASGTYPFGNIKNDTGANDGTPVDVNTYADFHQFFESLMFSAGITPNNLPDNTVNGFQLIQALEAFIRSRNATETSQGVLEVATQAETTAQSLNTKIITPAKLKQFKDFEFTFATDTTSSNWTAVGGTLTYNSVQVELSPCHLLYVCGLHAVPQ